MRRTGTGTHPSPNVECRPDEPSEWDEMTKVSDVRLSASLEGVDSVAKLPLPGSREPEPLPGQGVARKVLEGDVGVPRLGGESGRGDFNASWNFSRAP